MFFYTKQILLQNFIEKDKLTWAMQKIINSREKNLWLGIKTYHP
jgi:hypothetical protein